MHLVNPVVATRLSAWTIIVGQLRDNCMYVSLYTLKLFWFTDISSKLIITSYLKVCLCPMPDLFYLTIVAQTAMDFRLRGSYSKWHHRNRHTSGNTEAFQCCTLDTWSVTWQNSCTGLSWSPNVFIELQKHQCFVRLTQSKLNSNAKHFFDLR